MEVSENNINNNNKNNILESNDPEVIRELIQSIFVNNKCYDLMQNSSKGTVFETTIPFQLAFFALLEHDADTAPLWDPERRVFVGLMTVSDYIHALRIWRAQNLPSTELTSKTIRDMMLTAPLVFRHAGFQAIEAEDTVMQLCSLLLRTDNDYVPVVDPESGALVSILGYLDIVYMLNQAALQHPNLFSLTIEQTHIGTFGSVITTAKNTKLYEVLDILESKNMSGMPIIDENNKIIGFYHRSDVSFIIKASDPDVVISNLNNFTISDSLQLREQLLSTGEIMSTFQGLVVCRLTDKLGTVLNSMTRARSNRVVVVNDILECIGVISIKDIIRYYLNGLPQQQQLGR